MQILTIDNQNFDKLSSNQSNKTKVKIKKIKIFFLISNKQNFVLHMLSHRKNVRTSKF
jgi:hypothetical protein